MTTEDLSLEFDILFNNISSNMAPGLSEREKGIILTQAQEDIFVELYSGNSGSLSFESTEQLTSYLSSQVKELVFTPNEVTNRWSITLPDKVWFIVREDADIKIGNTKCYNDGTKTVQVLPVKHDDYYRIIENPFRGASTNRVLRLSLSDENSNRVSELYSKYPIESYSLRYVEKPSPIILEDYTDENNIQHTSQTSKFPEALHRTILLRAVQLAKAIWVG